MRALVLVREFWHALILSNASLANEHSVDNSPLAYAKEGNDGVIAL